MFEHLRTISILIIVLFCMPLHELKAQDKGSKRQLAQEYYRNKEYEKAGVLYKELYNNSKSKFYFNYYLKCLIETEEYDEAERTIKKQIRSHKNEMSYRVELGYLYRITGKTDRSEQEYEYAIKNVTLDHQHIINLANQFISKREFDYAEKLYLQAARRLHNLYNFKFELANLYYYSRNYEKMIETYLSVLIDNEAYIQTVQNKLQNAVYSDINNNLKDLLKLKLIEQIQHYPNKTVLNELLIWLYIQEKEFKKALIQVKALDRRNNEDGERIIALARLARNNKANDVAISAYESIMNKGKNSYYYYMANNEMLELLFQQIVNEKNYAQIDAQQLETKYRETLDALGLTKETAMIMKNLAHLQAFYLNKPDLAIKNLENTIRQPFLSKNEKARCMLELGDIYLFKGRVWDATMQYAEVELENKNNPTGSEAKYKKATLAYFLGNFQWAKAQLDVLKASTSKLIANDSFALSKIIEDNSILDENDEALTRFAAAELNYYQNQDSVAHLILDSLIVNYSGHTIIDEVYFLKADIFDHNKNYKMAEEYYKKVYNQFGFDVLGDDALLRLAELNQYRLYNKELAMQYYEELLMNYPESVHVVIARERFRSLRGDNIQ